MLLVHCRGYHKNSVLDSNEVGDVQEGLVHLRVGGDVVDGKKGSEVVHHVLGVVPECDHRQHHLQPYCNITNYSLHWQQGKYWKEIVVRIHEYLG